MTLDTTATVEQIRRVTDTAGNIVAPATEQLQQAIRDALGNQPGLTGFTHSTSGTTPEQLPANAVPDGVTVLLQADSGNSGPMQVGNNTVQPIDMPASGTVTLDVSDTSAIYVAAHSSGDSLGVLFEDG